MSEMPIHMNRFSARLRIRPPLVAAARFAPNTLTKIVAMITTHRKISTDTAEPIPRLSRLSSWL